MNESHGCTANAAEGKFRRSSAALALVVWLALLLTGPAALAIGEPIPGIDIVVKKNPGGIPVVVPIDDSGKFSLRLKEPGNHTISTACRQPSGCLPHKLSGALKPGTDGEPSIIAILIGLILPAQKASADGTSYTFTVGDRGIFLNGQFQGAAGVRVAVGDVNGDGVETRKAAPKKTAGKTGHAPKPTSTHGTHGSLKADEPLPDLPQQPGISDQGAAGNLSTYGTAPPPPKEDKLPSLALAGEPIPGVDVNLGKDPGGIVASSNTDNQGNFHFDKLPAGNYTLKLPGLPDQSLTVGPDGIAGGKVTRSPDGSMSIFDRWGKSVNNTDNKSTRGTATEKPVGFGSGNTMGAGPGAGLGSGMSPPGAAMGGAGGPGAGMNPMSPGAGGPMGGGSGGAMRP